MIHQQTCVRYVNGQIGYGVYATAPIPKGTIVYVRDPFETEISPELFSSVEECYRQVAQKYSFIDEKGNRVLSWDAAKYVNHCCNFNSISAGYGFEITVRDIAAGEELTDDYGLFNLDHDMFCCCGSTNCRRIVRSSDVDRYCRKWDQVVIDAMKYMRRVEQPLWPFMDADTKKSLCDYLEGRGRYVSVRALKSVARRRFTTAAQRFAKVPAAPAAQHVALVERRAAAV